MKVVPFHSLLGGMGERRKLVPGRSGAEPRPKTGFAAFGAWKNTSDGNKFCIFATHRPM